MTKKREYREDLLPPPPDVLPWEAYEKKYGTLQKTAGHVKRTVNGVKGVVIPAAEGTPWKSGPLICLLLCLCAWILHSCLQLRLQRVHGCALEKTDIIHDEDSDDLVTSQEAENVFEEMLAQKEEAFERAKLWCKHG